MKKSFKIISLCLFLFIAVAGYAQGPPDPNPDPSGGSNDIGGSAPLSGGFLYLILFGGLYAGGKTYLINRSRKKLV